MAGALPTYGLRHRSEGKHLFAPLGRACCVACVDSASPTPFASWRAVLVWFLVLAGVVAGLQAGVAWLARETRYRETHRQLDVLRRMIADFRERQGTYPRISDNAVLLSCLLGQIDANGLPIPGRPRWYLEGAQLLFRLPDPRTIGNQIIDPWGRPYLYIYLPASPEGPEGFMIVSSGADAKHSAAVAAGRRAEPLAVEDRDNVTLLVR